MSKKLFPLALILILSVLLRLPLLNSSLWMDEAAQAMESSRPLAEQTHIADDYQPPLFHVIVHFFLLVSHDEWWIRLPSLIAGIGTLAILYVLLEEKSTKNVAVLAALLLATSPFHIYFSQELRPYSVAAFFAILSWYILVSDHFGKYRWPWYTVATTLGLYSMYLIPFNILAQLLYVFFEQKKQLKSLICSLIAVACLFLPWLPSFVTQLHIGTQLTAQLPGWANAVGTPQLKVLPLTVAKFVVGPVEFHGNPWLVFVTALILAASTVMIIRFKKKNELKLFVYWFVLPLLTAWLVSFVVPVIQPKRVMFILPAFYAIVVLTSVKSKSGRIVLILMTCLQLLCLGIYWSNPAYQRENWKSLIQSIESQATSNSAVLFSFEKPFAPWHWYTNGTVKTIVTGRVYTSDLNENDSVASQLQFVSRIYLFDYLRDLTDPHHTLEQTLNAQGFQESTKIDAKAIGFVRIFARMN